MVPIWDGCGDSYNAVNLDRDVMVMVIRRMLAATMMMRRKMITKAGAMRESVDILTAPRSETRRSNQGTVAAKPTEDFNLDLHLK